jgi:hypothetical protein
MALTVGSSGPVVEAWQRVMVSRFKSYALAADGGPLRADSYFGYDDAAVQMEYQRRTGQVATGVVSDRDLAVLGLAKPVIFTVEGHLSDMFVGPCAFTAKALEDQGIARWQPVGYDNVSLPFRNRTGVDELDRLFSDTAAFPLGTPWELIIFSQGGIVGCRFFMEQIRPEGGRHHNRLKDLRGVLAFGNPYRQKDVIAPWVSDPPNPCTQGISDVRMTDTPSWWQEVSRHGDLYAENPDDEVGLNRSAIYKIAAESSWSGGKAGMLARVFDLLGDPVDGMIDIARAIIGGAMFVGNMGSHGTYDLRPGIGFLRARIAAA